MSVDPKRHPDLATFDRALAEHEVRQLADEIGYTTSVLDDGAIILRPPVDPERERRASAAIDALFDPARDECADCGTKLDALNRCQVVEHAADTGVSLVFVCPEHYAKRLL